MSKEVAVIDAEIVEAPVPLSEGQAQRLDKRIQQAGTRFADERGKLVALLKEAEEGQIHVGLGLPSWRDYVRERVHVSPANEVERKSMISLMSGKGFSQRDTAEAIGVNQSTVSRVLAEGDADASGETIGRDDKLYPKHPKPKKQEPLVVEEVEPPVEKRQPVSQDFAEEMGMLFNSVSSFKDIVADDRFPKARNTITKHQKAKLQGYIADLQKIDDELS